MSVNQRIITAVTPVVSVCVPEPYDPDSGSAEREYCTFDYTEMPDSFGDDGPEVIRYLIRLNYFAPRIAAAGESSNTMTKRKALRQAIFDAGFTYPSVENASDEEGQHFVFEFEDLDGEV